MTVAETDTIDRSRVFRASSSDFWGQEIVWPIVSPSNPLDVNIDMAWAPGQRWRTEIEYILASQDEPYQRTIYFPKMRFDLVMDLMRAYSATRMADTLGSEGISLCRFTDPRLDGGDLIFHTPSGEQMVMEFKAFHPRAIPNVRDRRTAEMEKTFRRFEALPENWDSYGGAAISPAAIETARWILTAVIDRNLPEPWIAPGGDGGIGMQWDLPRLELYIDIVPGEEITYLLTPLAENGSEIADAQVDAELTKDNLSEVLNSLAESTPRSIR